MYEKLKTAAEAIAKISSFRPKVGIVLGSGLGALVDKVDIVSEIDYEKIPFFHKTTVEGHQGRLILGHLNGVEVAVLQGRIHAYEGHPMEEVVFPVRTLAVLGIKGLVLTNAAGGMNPDYVAGDLSLITDHINFMGKNPLVGPNLAEWGPRFPDMTKAYCPKWREGIKEVASKLGIKLHEGIYAGVLGPTYETPAEIRMLRTLGGDMVGMSTVPESIAANHFGIKVVGISCITNMAAGIEQGPLKHEDIKERALSVMDKFTQLVQEGVSKFPGA